MKKNIILFLVVLSISIIITYPAFPPSHALDSYCTMCNGYVDTGIWFLQNGRIFSYLLFMIANGINLSYNALGFISVLFGNMVISLGIVLFFNEITKKVKFNNYLYKYLLLLLIFLLYYNPLYTSVLVFDEVVIMDLGILFLTLASIILLRGGLKNYFISLLLTIIGITCYQGIASYLFVILFVLIAASKDKFNNVKFYFNKFILSIINYGLSFVVNLFFIEIINKMFSNSNIKVGSFNIISNINKIITKLIPSSLRYLFNYVNVRDYYLLVFISTIILVIFILKNNNKSKNSFLLLLLVLSCLFVPFIPNIFMAEASNYTDARMTLTLGIIPVVIILFILLSFKIEKKYFYVIFGFSLVVFLLSFYLIRQNMLIDLKRYKNDVKYVNNVISEIDNYEQQSGKTIHKIYYHKDLDSAFYYNFGYPNGVNIRLMAVPWAFECAFNAVSNNKFIFEDMNEEKYNAIFYGQDYDEFSKKQLVFDGNSLYLLIY